MAPTLSARCSILFLLVAYTSSDRIQSPYIPRRALAAAGSPSPAAAAAAGAADAAGASKSAPPTVLQAGAGSLVTKVLFSATEAGVSVEHLTLDHQPCDSSLAVPVHFAVYYPATAQANDL